MDVSIISTDLKTSWTTSLQCTRLLILPLVSIRSCMEGKFSSPGSRPPSVHKPLISTVAPDYCTVWALPVHYSTGQLACLCKKKVRTSVIFFYNYAYEFILKVHTTQTLSNIIAYGFKSKILLVTNTRSSLRSTLVKRTQKTLILIF